MRHFNCTKVLMTEEQRPSYIPQRALEYWRVMNLVADSVTVSPFLVTPFGHSQNEVGLSAVFL